ncbi:hypothetical protein ACQPXM_24885 [Kribbella sp. CA-253562]|uniref:hypothetical protein n=1 Tax=Kribbella sp. CA-253562 TaxID=3239942 RepID=UPI003D927B00
MGERDDRYHFGATPEQVVATLHALLAKDNDIPALLGASEQYWAVVSWRLERGTTRPRSTSSPSCAR